MKYSKSTELDWKQCKGYKKQIILDERNLNSRGSLVQLISINPRTTIKPHFHKKMTEVFYILEGKGIIFIDDVSYSLENGDMLMCEPKEVHGARNKSDQELKYIVFKTNAEKNDIYWVGKSHKQIKKS